MLLVLDYLGEGPVSHVRGEFVLPAPVVKHLRLALVLRLSHALPKAACKPQSPEVICRQACRITRPAV